MNTGETSQIQGYLEINEDKMNNMTILNKDPISLTYDNGDILKTNLEVLQNGIPKDDTYIGYNLELGYNFKDVSI